MAFSSPRFRPRNNPKSLPIVAYHRARWAYMRGPKAYVKFNNSTHKVFRLRGTFDRQALEKAVAFLLGRHRILQAHVKDGARGPRFVFDGPPIRVGFHTFPGPARVRDARKQASRLVWRRLADDGPWFRVFVLRLSAQDHVIGLVIHHFIADSVSISIAAVELMAAYQAFAAGQPPVAPPPALQYTDYVAGIGEWLRDGGARSQEVYWREQLKDAPAVHLEGEKRPAASARGTEIALSFRLPEKLVAKIRAQTRCNNIAMVTLMTASMAVALAEYGKTNDVVIQNMISGRSDLRLASVIGAFFDSVALRLRVDEMDTRADLLARTRKTVLGAYAHQAFSYHLVGPLLPKIGATGPWPILNFFNFFGGGMPRASMGLERFTLESAPRPKRKPHEQKSFTLRLVHDSEGIAGAVEYLDIRYTPRVMRRFVTSFEKALGEFAKE